MKARVAVLGVIALTAVACSSSSGGSSNAASTSPPAVPPSSASPTGSATPSPSATPTPSFSSTVQASHRCRTAHLSLSIGPGNGAAGSTVVPIVLTNTGAGACTLYGYPGVSFLDASGNQLGADASHNGAEAGVVTLAPHASAHALLQEPEPGNYSAASCQEATSAKLRVYPPGDFSPLTVADVTQVCTTKNGWSSVSPVTPGSGG